MIFSKVRRARKLWRCGCGGVIFPGSKYLEQIATPSHEDLGNTHWWKIQECIECATRYGRRPSEETLA